MSLFHCMAQVYGIWGTLVNLCKKHTCVQVYVYMYAKHVNWKTVQVYRLANSKLSFIFKSTLISESDKCLIIFL